MYFKQFFLESLGHASYPIGSEQTGEALVLYPQRKVEAYFEIARAQGMVEVPGRAELAPITEEATRCLDAALAPLAGTAG